MAHYCEYAELEHGHYELLRCVITNQSCGFQRRCNTDGCIKHTNNFATCVLRRKKDGRRKRKKTLSSMLKKRAEKKKKEIRKKKYKVVVACDKFVIYVDENKNNVKLWGDYKVKTGDYLEV